MKIVTLSAQYPLVKTFTLRGEQLEKSPYPNAYNFTSHAHEISDLSTLYKVLRTTAAEGHCLLKGALDRDLNNEPRAGSTTPHAETTWICLDIDGLKNINSVDTFMKTVGLGDISYIVQYSASMGVDVTRGLSAHVFCILSAPVAAPFLKQWLIKLNLETPKLAAEISLTRTGNALRWPLDITTCQNDKLIYIAPPILGPGVVDQFKGERLRLIKKDHAALPISRISVNTATNQKAARDLLNTLRKEAGYTRLTDSQYKVKNTITYISKPGEATITGMKEERGFVYFNLNGGDSWGYYHPDNNPEFIFNFKGEPAYRTEELLPEYWRSLKPAAQTSNHGREYFICRDFKTDRLYNGYYDRDNDAVVMARAANEGRLHSFLKQHGQPVPDFVPDWDLKHDPHSTVKYDPENKTLNLYTPSPYYALSPRKVIAVPKTIQRIIEHAVGTGVTYEAFIHWCADIIQNREPTGIAWLAHGNQGTGKGILFHKILAPLLGLQNTHSMLMGQLESPFNSYLETSILIFVDEVQLSQLNTNGLVNAALKHYITEPMLAIRRMYTEVYHAKNNGNFFFASNQPDPIMLEITDRRYNIGMFQAKRINITDAEIEEIQAELEDFFMYLFGLKINYSLSRKIVDTEDRKLLISINRTSIDEVADAILAGNLEYFLDQLPTSDDPLFATPTVAAYRNLMIQLLLTGEEFNNLSREELFIIYDYCVGGTPRSPNKFTSMLKHHRLYIKPIKRKSLTIRGVDVDWKHSKEWFQEKRTQYTEAKSEKIIPLVKKAN